MTSFSRPSPGKVTVSHRSSWGVSGHRKSDGGHWTPISPIPARALPKHSHGPPRIPALWMWSGVGCVARSHCARSCGFSVGSVPADAWGQAQWGMDRDFCICYQLLPQQLHVPAPCHPLLPQFSITEVSPITPESPQNGLLVDQASFFRRTHISQGPRGQKHVASTSVPAVFSLLSQCEGLTVTGHPGFTPPWVCSLC